MSLRNGVMLILAAATGVAASRLPMPDGDRLAAAFGRYGGDAGQGIRSMVWETARAFGPTAGTLPWDVIVPVAVGIVLSVIAVVAAVRLGRRRAVPARRPGRAPAVPRVQRARQLSAAGRPALDVARQTTLSRDAMALMVRISALTADPDGIAGPGRSFRGQQALGTGA